MHRPFALWILAVSLVFLALGGLYGGIAMLTDPSGGSLQMAEILPLLLVPNYILPGLFLIVVMGLAPLWLTYGLLMHPNWRWVDTWSRWSGYYWAWTGTLALGLVLMLWLIVQALLIGYRWPIQYVTTTNGLLILLLVSVPGVRKFFSK